MSFFDEYKEISGDWLSAEEMQALMENGIPVTITGVGETRASWGEQYVLTVLVPNPEEGTEEERLRGFGKDSAVESRNRMLEAMKEYFERDAAEPITVKFEKVGRSILIRQA